MTLISWTLAFSAWHLWAGVVGWWNPTPRVQDSILLSIVCVLFLSIDPRWDIHRQMTSDLLSLDGMTELPEYPCSHPSKSRSQNRMPEVNSGSIALARACKFLFACSCYHFLYFNLTLSFLSLYSPPSPFYLSLPLIHERNTKEHRSKYNISAILFKHPLRMWQGAAAQIKVQSFCLPAALLIGSSINLTFHLLPSVSLDLWSQTIFMYLLLGFQSVFITFVS